MICSRWLTTAALLAALAVVGTAMPLRADQPSLEQRRRALERMSEVEKNELLRKKNRFDQLSEEEKKHLRQLCDRLAADPQHDQLLKVLQRYSEWLRRLPPGQRAQILNLPPDQRIAKIKETLKSQETQRFRMIVDEKLSPEDNRIILDWLNEFIKQHETEVLAALPKDRRPPENLDPQRRRQFIRYCWFRSSSSNMPHPSAEEKARLIKMLSRDARSFLAKLDSDEARARVLRIWVFAALFSRRRPSVSPQQLRTFVAERLTQEQREYLFSLRRDRMYRELEKLYLRDAGHRMGSSKGPFFRGNRRRGPGADGKKPPPHHHPPFPKENRRQSGQDAAAGASKKTPSD